jgi:hypothetical protein
MRQAGMDVSTDEAIVRMLSDFASYILPLQQLTDGALTDNLLAPGVYGTADDGAHVDVIAPADSNNSAKLLQVVGRANNATLLRTDIPAGKVCVGNGDGCIDESCVHKSGC